MPVYTIQDSALQLSTLYSQPYQIRNSGTETIFIGKDTTVNSTQYDWSLSPGDTLGFTATTMLYVICESGKTSTLEQQYGALGNFTPGPSDVIARLSNDLTLLDTDTIFINAGAQNQAIQMFDIDVSKYASILVSIRGTMSPVGGLLPVTELNRLEGTLEFYNEPLVGSFVDAVTAYNPQWLMLDKNVAGTNRWVAQSIQVPVTARLFLFRLLALKQNTPGLVSGEINISIYGSNEQIVAPRYISQGLGLDNGLTAEGVVRVTSAVIGATTVFISSRNGPSTMSLYKSNGPTQSVGILDMLDSGTIKTIARPFIAVSGSIVSIIENMQLPLLPLRLTFSMTAAIDPNTSISLTQ